MDSDFHWWLHTIFPDENNLPYMVRIMGKLAVDGLHNSVPLVPDINYFFYVGWSEAV
jgi:hypothetical protein